MLRDFIPRIRRCGIALIVMAAAGIAPLSACGVKGPLKLPAPPATATGARPSETPAAPAQEAPAESSSQPPATRP